jgi:hypothetical protein
MAQRVETCGAPLRPSMSMRMPFNSSPRCVNTSTLGMLLFAANERTSERAWNKEGSVKALPKMVLMPRKKGLPDSSMQKIGSPACFADATPIRMLGPSKAYSSNCLRCRINVRRRSGQAHSVLKGSKRLMDGVFLRPLNFGGVRFIGRPVSPSISTYTKLLPFFARSALLL